MPIPGIRGLAIALLVSSLTLGPALAGDAPRSPRPPRPESERLKDADVDFVDSEHAGWNTRAVNDTIYHDGSSVNSVMLEKSSQHGRKLNVLLTTRIEELQVVERPEAPPPTLIRIQGRSRELSP